MNVIGYDFHSLLHAQVHQASTKKGAHGFGPFYTKISQIFRGPIIFLALPFAFK